MKKLYLMIVLCILGMGYAQAQQIYSVRTSDFSSIQLTLTAPVPTVATTSYMDVDYNVLQMSGFGTSMTVGEPMLPMFGYMVELPLCDGLRVKTLNARYDTIDGATLGLTAKIMPVQRPRTKSDRSPLTLEKNEATYGTDAFYGETLVTVEQVGVARNQNLGVLHFAPVQYNPVTNQVVVCRSVDVTISYVNADMEATQEMQVLHYSPAFAAAATMNTLPRKDAAYQGAPVRYLIVANSMFNGQLNDFVTWKKRKGFRVDVVYTSDANVGTTATSIQNYIKSLYTNATAEDPAPTFVLLVGDVAQIPNHSSTVSGSLDSDHPTDLYYATWTTGDNIPDCYYGRFSATNATQLSAEIAKTLTYEQYTFTDPSFLNTAILVAGVDGGRNNDNGYKFADPTHDYAITNYMNGSSPYPFSTVMYYKNAYTSYPSVSNLTVASNGNSMCSSTVSSTIRGEYTKGAAWINYSAHGDVTEWSCPEMTVTQVNSDLNNTGKFGVMIGNCCLSNKFTEGTCYGESLLRKENAGAVGYIGGSNYTYWYQDLYWGVGYRSSVANSGTGVGMDMSINNSYPGAYDLLCHTNGEPQSTWHTSLGAVVAAGNNAVQTSGTSSGYNFPLYYWEIYHLMGDPSITPWLTTPDNMTMSVASSITQGTTSLEVTAVPYAYVAMTTGSDEYSLVAAAFANASGVATLALPSDLAVGTYEVVASAQQYKTVFAPVSVIVPAGPYVLANEITEDSPLYVGQGTTYTLELENVGTQAANNITISFTSNNPLVTVVEGTASVSSMNASATQTLNGVFSVQADASCTDQMPVQLTATVSWTGCEQPAVARLNTVVNAPKPVVTYTWNPTRIAPGGSAVCNVTMTNEGHMAMDNVTMTFTEDFPLVEVTGGPNTFNLAVGGTVNYSYTATVDAQMPDNVTIPFNLNVANESYNYSEELRLLVSATSNGDNFDDGDVNGWTGGTYPWVATNAQYHSASYSMRSANSLRNSRTSEMSYTYSSDIADSVRFYYKVSSETNYDFFYFYIDGAEQTLPSGNSGEVDWTYAAYAVAAGSHTYKFAYVKDYSTTSGSDCAWVDDVEFPTTATALQTARSEQVCQNGSYTLNGAAVNTSTVGTQYLIENLTSGTGNLVELNVVGTIESAPIPMEACGSYTWNGTNYTTSGNYTYNGTSVAGCDSVATLNLTILPTYTITYVSNGGNGTMAAQEVCSGETVNLTANGFTNSNATFAGWATSANGSVEYADGAEVTVTGNMTLYAIWNISCTDQTATVTVTECGSYTWYGTEYTTSGTYTHTVENAVEGGCDSIYTLNLTINPIPEVNISGNIAITIGNSTTLTASGATSYEWNTGAHTASITVSPSSSTTYTVTGTTAGCEGTASVTVNASAAGTTYGTITATACDSYEWYGETYTASGNYTHTLTGANAQGADSVITLVLTINNSVNTTETETACDSYEWYGTTYTTSNTYTHNGTTAAGCPQTETLVLTINHSTSGTETETACDGYTWSVTGERYTATGMYNYTGVNAAGCSDTRTLNLTINQSTSSSETLTECDSYTWNANHQTYTESGVYTYTTTNAVGCPNVATLNLTLLQSTTAEENYQGCDRYSWHGETYTTSGDYTYTTTAANGCSNIITLHLTLGYSTTSVDVEEACDSYTWDNGITYTASTEVPTMTSTNAEGCPETITLHLTINRSATTSLVGEVAVGEIYNANGFYAGPYSETGSEVLTQNLYTVNGCDSTVTLTLYITQGQGIDDVETFNMSLYPNPASSMVTVAVENAAQAELAIYDIYGRKLDVVNVEGEETVIDLGQYAKGVYFVRLYRQGELMGTSKFVKQ